MMEQNPPKVLALDSSSLSGSVALCHGSTLVAEFFLNARRTHSEKLISQIDQLLGETGWTLKDIDLFAAVTGPGSFTGLRIGIATLKGLAQVLDKPVAAVSSLETAAMHGALCSVPVCAFLDARKSEVYAQLFSFSGNRPVALNDARVLPPESLLEELDGPVAFVGTGVPVYKDMITQILGSQALLPPPAAYQLRAFHAAWLALGCWLQGRTHASAELQPTYIRPSDAELNFPPNKALSPGVIG